MEIHEIRQPSIDQTQYSISNFQYRKKRIIHFSNCVFFVNRSFHLPRIYIPDIEVNLINIGFSSSNQTSRMLKRMKLSCVYYLKGRLTLGLRSSGSFLDGVDVMWQLAGGR